MTSSSGSSCTTPDKLESATPKIETDPNVVDWDGPNDPENPRNWPVRFKWANIVIISILALITYVSRSFLSLF